MQRLFYSVFTLQIIFKARQNKQVINNRKQEVGWLVSSDQ